MNIVADYVRHTKGWANDTYTVQFNRRDGKMLVFWVLYKSDNFRTPGGGGGKSFAAILNPDTKRSRECNLPPGAHTAATPLR